MVGFGVIHHLSISSKFWHALNFYWKKIWKPLSEFWKMEFELFRKIGKNSKIFMTLQFWMMPNPVEGIHFKMLRES